MHLYVIRYKCTCACTWTVLVSRGTFNALWDSIHFHFIILFLPNSNSSYSVTIEFEYRKLMNKNLCLINDEAHFYEFCLCLMFHIVQIHHKNTHNDSFLGWLIQFSLFSLLSLYHILFLVLVICIRSSCIAAGVSLLLFYRLTYSFGCPIWRQPNHAFHHHELEPWFMLVFLVKFAHTIAVLHTPLYTGFIIGFVYIWYGFLFNNFALPLHSLTLSLSLNRSLTRSPYVRMCVCFGIPSPYFNVLLSNESCICQKKKKKSKGKIDYFYFVKLLFLSFINGFLYCLLINFAHTQSLLLIYFWNTLWFNTSMCLNMLYLLIYRCGPPKFLYCFFTSFFYFVSMRDATNKIRLHAYIA